MTKSIARKRFGQHFLHDAEVIERIITAIQPLPTQHLVEIGPGRGALTFALLQHCEQLEAIELDRDLVPLLQQRALLLQQQNAHFGQLKLHQADALALDWADLRQDERRLRVVGNLPYNISTPLIFRLLADIEHIADMHFMLQKEVAERITAGLEWRIMAVYR